MEVNKLNKGLKLRHIQFLALGSAIGTGLFYGSYESIMLAGPSVLLTYIFSGIAVYIIMRSLGEMIASFPNKHSFSDYISSYLGIKAGFVTGWAYVLEMLIVCLADLTAFAIYMRFWFPEINAGIWVAIALVFVGIINFISVKAFGEIEFYLTIIKVLAITLMIIAGIYLVFFNDNLPSSQSSIHNFTMYGGFFANGIKGFIASFPLVAFAFGGIEILGVTVAESDNPEKAIPKAINTIPFRIIFFYVLTIFIILTLVPWNTLHGESSPFVMIFDSLGISYAANILNVIVISASLSAINSDVFSSSRIIYSMVKMKQAPSCLDSISKYGIPWKITLLVLLLLSMGVLFNAIFPEQLFLIIASSASLVTIFVWGMILISQISMRKKLNLIEIKFKTLYYPYAQIASLVFLSFIVVTMIYFETTRISVIITGALISLLFIIAYKKYR